MSTILERILIAIAIVGLITLYGLIGTSDMEAAEDSASHTAWISEQAKQDEITDHHREWERMVAWGEQFAPVAAK